MTGPLLAMIALGGEAGSCISPGPAAVRIWLGEGPQSGGAKAVALEVVLAGFERYAE